MNNSTAPGPGGPSSLVASDVSTRSVVGLGQWSPRQPDASYGKPGPFLGLPSGRGSRVAFCRAVTAAVPLFPSVERCPEIAKTGHFRPETAMSGQFGTVYSSAQGTNYWFPLLCKRSFGSSLRSEPFGVFDAVGRFAARGMHFFKSKATFSVADCVDHWPRLHCLPGPSASCLRAEGSGQLSITTLLAL